MKTSDYELLIFLCIRLSFQITKIKADEKAQQIYSYFMDTDQKLLYL